MEQISVDGRLVPGHRVASGQNGDPRFPGGTLRMQRPHFQARGLDLGAYHAGTLNVAIAPCTFAPRRAAATFRDVRWHPAEPPEDFSFFTCRLHLPDGRAYDGLVYYPHPETKPEHHQPPDVLEVLAPYIDGLRYGDRLTLVLNGAEADVRC